MATASMFRCVLILRKPSLYAQASHDSRRPMEPSRCDPDGNASGVPDARYHPILPVSTVEQTACHPVTTPLSRREDACPSNVRNIATVSSDLPRTPGMSTMPGQSVPVVTPAEMAQVDRVMIEELGVEVLQLMELAGRAIADWARERFLGDASGKRILVLAGSGGNGGDGLVAARLLHAWGALPKIRLSHEVQSLRGAASHQAQSLAALGIPLLPTPAAQPPSLPETDLIIDGLLGFGLSGPPTGASALLIEAANAHPAPILAIDLPSGLDAATGEPYRPCIRADATLTLALPKTGLLSKAAGPYVGELAVADIGVPAAAYARLGLDIAPLFGEGSIVRVEQSSGRVVRETEQL